MKCAFFFQTLYSSLIILAAISSGSSPSTAGSTKHSIVSTQTASEPRYNSSDDSKAFHLIERQEIDRVLSWFSCTANNQVRDRETQDFPQRRTLQVSVKSVEVRATSDGSCVVLWLRYDDSAHLLSMGVSMSAADISRMWASSAVVALSGRWLLV